MGKVPWKSEKVRPWFVCTLTPVTCCKYTCTYYTEVLYKYICMLRPAGGYSGCSGYLGYVSGCLASLASAVYLQMVEQSHKLTVLEASLV